MSDYNAAAAALSALSAQITADPNNTALRIAYAQQHSALMDLYAAAYGVGTADAQAARQKAKDLDAAQIAYFQNPSGATSAAWTAQSQAYETARQATIAPVVVAQSPAALATAPAPTASSSSSMIWILVAAAAAFFMFSGGKH